MTSEIDKLKHFHVEDYSGIYFTDELNAGEEFLYTTIGIKDDKEVTFDGTCQNRRKSDVFKEPNGSIHYNGAFSKRPISRYNFDTKEWTDNKNPICWHGGLFEYKDNILTGRYFSICLLQQHDINKGWMPKPTQIIDCVEVEISPDNWIMAVDINNIDLIKLDINYNIQWEECSCLKGIRLEDVTEELEDKAYEEMRHN